MPSKEKKEKDKESALSIKKNLYIFNIRKKVKNKKNLKVKKKYTPQSKELSDLTKKIKPRNIQIQKKFIILGILVLLLVLGGYLLLSSLSSIQVSEDKEPVIPNMQFTIFEKDTDIVNYGKNGELVAYFLIDYNIMNANSLNAKIDVYGDVDSKTVYFLKSDKYEPKSSEFLIFKEELRTQLIKEGYTFNEKTKEELYSLPESSIILIPTGHLPRDFILSEKNLLDLIKNKNIVIYIGYPFDQALDYNGDILALDKNTLDFTFTFNEDLRSDDKLISSGLNLQSPRYKVSYLRTDPTMIFGCISSFKIDDGYMIFIPQYIDDGWKDGKTAAKDITKIITLSSWHKPIASKEMSLETKRNTISMFSNPVTPQAKYAKITFTGQGEYGGFKKQVEVSKLEKKTLGVITLDSWPIHPYKVTRKNIFFSIAFKEIDQKNINPNIFIYSSNTLIKTETLGSTFSNTIISKSFTPDFEPGNYLVVIQEGGNQYSKYLLDVKDISIGEIGRADFNRGNFKFKIQDSEGNQVVYSQLIVRVDGKEIKTFKLGEPVEIMGYQGLSSGAHVFSFDFGNGLVRDIEITNQGSNIFDPIINNPINLALLFITIISVVIALYIKRPEKQMYSLDIPDFPPVSSIKVPMKEREVLDVFENMNKEYSWKYMPLTLEELKTGFSKITKGGRRIVVGEYNLELLLDKLIARDLVKEKDYYYILSSWEEKSKKNVSYLVMFRKLRDLFLDNVVKFTSLGKAKECDVCIEVSGEKIFLHIFTNINSAFNALKTVNLGQTIVLFDSISQIEEFKETLSSSNRSIIAFKLELNNGNIFLYTTEELKRFIETAKIK
ncbi:hypothetical protein KO317_03115 [Candidatus Micrarchaeota archaeon]|nr:hypothetical protein [Candidatus Micrarchaeota archaeon]